MRQFKTVKNAHTGMHLSSCISITYNPNDAFWRRAEIPPNSSEAGL